MFDIGATTGCTNIATVDDNIHEEDEIFFVSLSSISDSVVITLSSATVRITDNDGRKC